MDRTLDSNLLRSTVVIVVASKVTMISFMNQGPGSRVTALGDNRHMTPA